MASWSGARGYEQNIHLFDDSGVAGKVVGFVFDCGTLKSVKREEG
jgi:hypothetical protein